MRGCRVAGIRAAAQWSVLRGVRLGLGEVHRAGLVLGGAVDRVEPQRARAGVGDVVPPPGRHQDDVVVGQLALERQVVAGRAHDDPTGALLDAQELVDVVVHLEADLLLGLEAHQGQLEVRAGPQGGAERAVAAASPPRCR